MRQRETTLSTNCTAFQQADLNIRSLNSLVFSRAANPPITRPFALAAKLALFFDPRWPYFQNEIPRLT
jgi:hypothetical protein